MELSLLTVINVVEFFLNLTLSWLTNHCIDEQAVDSKFGELTGLILIYKFRARAKSIKYTLG